MTFAEESFIMCEKLRQEGMKAFPGINCVDDKSILETPDAIKSEMSIMNERPILGLDFSFLNAIQQQRL